MQKQRPVNMNLSSDGKEMEDGDPAITQDIGKAEGISRNASSLRKHSSNDLQMEKIEGAVNDRQTNISIMRNKALK